jgi:spore germination cell wall hydrolase CwlJ-like protein
MSSWQTYQVPDLYLTALCCWREARGESQEGQRGVLHVIRNRALCPGWWGNGYADVVLHPSQFSSFNVGDPNAALFPQAGDTQWAGILNLADRVMTGQDEDPTGGATHYFNPGVALPGWAASMTKTASIGHHDFYKQ